MRIVARTPHAVDRARDAWLDPPDADDSVWCSDCGNELDEHERDDEQCDVCADRTRVDLGEFPLRYGFCDICDDPYELGDSVEANPDTGCHRSCEEVQE